MDVPNGCPVCCVKSDFPAPRQSHSLWPLTERCPREAPTVQLGTLSHASGDTIAVLGGRDKLYTRLIRLQFPQSQETRSVTGPSTGSAHVKTTRDEK